MAMSVDGGSSAPSSSTNDKSKSSDSSTSSTHSTSSASTSSDGSTSNAKPRSPPAPVDQFVNAVKKGWDSFQPAAGKNPVAQAAMGTFKASNLALLNTRDNTRLSPSPQAKGTGGTLDSASGAGVTNGVKAQSFDAKVSGDAGTAETSGTGASPKPMDPAQVKQAQDDYENKIRYETDSGARQSQLLILTEGHQDQPDYLATMVGLAKQPAGPLNDLVAGQNGLFVKDDNGRFTYGSDDERKAVATALSAAVDKGTLTLDEIHARTGSTTPADGWYNASVAIGAVQAGGVSPQANDAVNQVNSDLRAFRAANQDAKEADERLSQEIARFGPGLDDTQRTAFIKAFHDQNKDAYEKQKAAAETLANDIDGNKDLLLDAATHDPTAAGTLYQSLQELSNTPAAKTAVALGKQIETADPDSALGTAFAGKDVDKDILEKGIPNAAGQLLVESGGNKDVAGQKLKDLLSGLDKSHEFLKSDGEAREAWDALGEVEDGNGYDKLDKVAKEGGGNTALSRGFLAASIVLGTADGAEAAGKGKLAESIKDFADAGKKSLQLFSDVSKSLAGAGKLAEFSGDALKAADYASHLAPGLGLISSGASIVARAGEIKANDPASIAQVFGILGDLTSGVGSLMELFPVTAPVGAVFDAVGTAVSVGADFLGGAIKAAVYSGEEHKCLSAAGITGQVQDAYRGMGADQMKTLSNNVGLTPAQIQQFCAAEPNIAQAPGLNHALTLMAQHYGLTGQNFLTFLQKAESDASGDSTKNLYDTAYLVASEWTDHGMTDPDSVNAVMDSQVQNKYPTAWEFTREVLAEESGT